MENIEQRQKDLVLTSNEFAFIMSKTNGAIKTYVGPTVITVGGQESLVTFNSKTKRFEETTNLNEAKQLFASAPEGWYIILKNPAKDNIRPELGKACASPELEIGKKIIIPGPCSFALFPGQMAKIIQGHRLRSNQYLLARVYDAEIANEKCENLKIKDENGNPKDFTVGQLLVIKGTEMPFFIPSTGIEVIPVGEKGSEYARDAVTLERLEYAILKAENGNKRYVQGPAVVYPEPTEVFVQTPRGETIFKALELSPISGIYVKVLDEYKEEDGTERKVGEELFITGNDQMIYYPRPEHALILYDGKYMHHAIAIPEGEGRYILNRLTGDIKTIVGPAMYLPDPRTEVVVKRKLSEKECTLMFPNNVEVLAYNKDLNECSLRKKIVAQDSIELDWATANQEDSLAIFETNANISRGTSYTKPRTITLDTKYDGIVSLRVFDGYAINVVSTTGEKEIVVGPATRLLNYNETIEPIMLYNEETGYLPLKDIMFNLGKTFRTEDNVDVTANIKMSFYFDKMKKDQWFSVYNIDSFIIRKTERIVSQIINSYSAIDFLKNIYIIENQIKEEIDKNIDFENGINISNCSIDILRCSSFFEEGMRDYSVRNVQEAISVLIKEKEAECKAIKAEANSKILEADIKIKENIEKVKAKERELAINDEKHKIAIQELMNEKILAEQQAKEIDFEFTQKCREIALNEEKTRTEIETKKQVAILQAITPGLIEALKDNKNATMLGTVTKNLAPYAMAKGENTAEYINTLFRGTTIESLFTNEKNEND